MATERRYTDDEVAFIMKQASAAQDVPSQAALPSAEGLTLAQLQEIGAEVGIAPDQVARAAASVGGGRLVPTKRRYLLGLPIGVSRTIDFGRAVSDQEWDQIVVELRETFAARGRVWSEGGLRQWANGNLQALLEPTPAGHRLRLTTRKGNAPGMIAAGALFLGGAAVQMILTALGGGTVTTAGMSALWAGVGAALIASAAVQLPKWARTRAEQMETIAGRTLKQPTS